MKRLPIFLIRLIFICLFGFLTIETYGYAPMVDKFNSLTKWLLPAYLYCFLFGIIMFIGLIIISSLYKKKINHFYKQLHNYLRANPFTSVDLGGTLLSIPLGLISVALYRTHWFSSVGIIIPLMLMLIIILSIGTLRNKIINYHILKYLSFICVIAFLSSLFFIIASLLGFPLLEQEFYNWSYEHDFIISYNHPFDSLKFIWIDVPIFFVLVPLADIIVLIGKILFKMPIISYIKSLKEAI